MFAARTFGVYHLIEPALIAGVFFSTLDRRGPISPVLDVKALQGIGLISYSLYLWQQLFLVGSAHGRPLGILEEFPLDWLACFPCALASYYLGGLPFVLGALYFWADMSRSAFASQRLAGGALGMAALFLWMKFWQAIFARNLRALISGEPLPPLSFGRCPAAIVNKRIVHRAAPSGG